MGYDGLDKASSFGRCFVLLIMDGAPQHALIIAAAVLEQTGQRSCAVAVP